MHRSVCRVCSVLRTGATNQQELRRLLNGWGREELPRGVEALWRDRALNDRNMVHATYRLLGANKDAIPLAEDILHEAIERVASGNLYHSQSVARLCYCWAKLRPSLPLPECLSDVLCDESNGHRCRRVARLSSGPMGGLLWAYARSPSSPGCHKIFTIVVEHLSSDLTVLQSYPTRDACIVLWSLATYWKHHSVAVGEVLPSQLMTALVERALAGESVQPREISMSLWSIATIELWRADPTRTVLGMARRAVELALPMWPEKFSKQELGNVLWAATREDSLLNSENVHTLVSSACKFLIEASGDLVEAFKTQELAMISVALSTFLTKVETQEPLAAEALILVLNSITSLDILDDNIASFAQAMLPVAMRVDDAAKDRLLMAAEKALAESRLDTTSLVSLIDLYDGACPSVSLMDAWQATSAQLLRSLQHSKPVEIRSVGNFGARDICEKLDILGVPNELPQPLESKLMGHRFAAAMEFSLMPEDGDGESISKPPTVSLPLPKGTATATVLTPAQHGWLRSTEPDFQALEEVARLIEAHRTTHDCGWVRLVISRPPCVSSLGAMVQFTQLYPDVHLQVWFHDLQRKL